MDEYYVVFKIMTMPKTICLYKDYEEIKIVFWVEILGLKSEI